MRVSVVQPGARLHYAAPQVFARAGILRRLYTDIHGEHEWLRAIDTVVPKAMQPKPIRRLLGRRLPSGLDRKLVNDRAILSLLSSFRGDRAAVVRSLLADMENSDLGEGDTVYTVLINEDNDVMRRLKQRGVKIVHECILGPDVPLLLAEERSRFDGLEVSTPSEEIAAGRQQDREKYGIADAVLVPSSFAYRGVAELASSQTKIETVPYGVDTARFLVAAQPEIGRVLCVGNVSLFKGHPYLAGAARLLDGLCNVRAVGPVRDSFATHPAMNGPNYVGQVPRAEIVEEYRRADVFAFPTLCDSFGLVLIEAMAMGLPVVCTPNCGDVVRNGVDGFIVPIRDTECLADRIKTIVSDRELRDWMSHNAKQRVREFSLDAYSKRLLAAMNHV